MAERHALLIGVPHCDDDRYSDIADVVRADVDGMRRSLEQSGYQITVFGVDGCEPTASRIRRAIRTACRQAPPGGVLLLYFSGHGVSVDGRDYLVPGDAGRDEHTGRPDLDDLVEVVPDLTHCKARLVVFFVDACRDDPAGERAPDSYGVTVTHPAGGSFLLVSGCRGGQRCAYTETGSIFTQALAQVLDRRHPARRLSQVLDEVTREMRRKTARTEGVEQAPDVRPQDMLPAVGDIEICEGDELTGAWRRAAENAALWRHCAAQEPSTAALEAVLGVVGHCARQCRSAYAELEARTGITDPWFDQNHPARVLERMALLLDENVVLGPDEAAVLVAVPFLREVVLAEGIRLAAGIAPTDFTRTYREGPRTDLEITHEMHQQVVRRAEGLAHRGLTDERDALAMWLVHQWLAARLVLWHGPAARDCCARGAQLLEGCAIGMAPREVPLLVETLLRAVGARPVDHHLKQRLRADHLPERWRALACLLWLGGVLAADIRTMPSVIADHIGTRMELPLPTVRNHSDRPDWHRDGDALDLRMFCDHPALHAAFQDVVTRADRTRTTIAELSVKDEIMDALPARITGTGLRPEHRTDGTPAYDVPLSRFQLSEDKIRELLMGRQLYDDPALALRELYQNALDACRYRATRLEGLRRAGKHPAPWTGLISFRQGFEGDREYIECEDNGVGMDINTLKHVFANAGERFVYREEYRAEQAGWQELDPPLQLISNSQFGVGVFSYFMLADEITVITRPVGRNGIVAPQAYRVDIASGGSLFQIVPTVDDIPAGGTRVRLYLSGDDNPVSVLQTLRALLWIAEYRVEVTEHDSPPQIWRPAELSYHDETAESLQCGEHLWWVSGEGGLAADGIRTNEEIFGLIVNLRESRRPQFTVDRKKLREWDKEWVHQQITESLPQLMEWPGLTLTWLWQVNDSAPDVAQQIFDHIVRTGKAIPMGSAWGRGIMVKPGQIGCLPQDAKLFDPIQWNIHYGRWFASWRAGHWTEITGFRTNVRNKALTGKGEGFPLVDPTDAEILNRLRPFHSDRAVTADNLLLAAAHPEQTAADRLSRLRRYAITGLDISRIRDCPPSTVPCKEEDSPLFRALAAWERPGAPAHRAIIGWLVKTSAELGQPIGEVLRRTAKFAPDGWTAPSLELGKLADYTCTTADAKLVSVDLDGEPPWIEDALQPMFLVEASAALSRDFDQILALCDNLAPLNLVVAARDRYPEDLTPLEVEALRHVPVVGQPLTPMHLVMIAGRMSVSVREAHHALGRLVDAGLLQLPDIAALPDLAPDLEDVMLIESNMLVWRPGRQRRYFTPDKPCITIAAMAGGRRVRQRISARARALAPFAAPDAPITYPELINLAAELLCSLGEARRALLDTFPDADVPELPAGCAELTPWLEERAALVGPPWMREEPVTWWLHPGEIVAGAVSCNQSLGDFLRELLPYRALGAPLPDLDAATMAELSAFVPDEYDVDMLVVFDKYGAERYIRDISPLQLVQIAGRLDWSPAEAHRRLMRLVPIGVTLSYPGDACPDQIVRWQDLLLLTEFLDGQEPAVFGLVPASHLAKAAAETGESLEWITGRLRLYAPLFGLTLEEDLG